MQQSEFEERIGRRVSPDEYDSAERVYMACPTVDKNRFCREWRGKRLDKSVVVADLIEHVKRLEFEKQQWQRTAEMLQKIGRWYRRRLYASGEATRVADGEREAPAPDGREPRPGRMADLSLVCSALAIILSLASIANALLR